jgi:hypothetical protein
LNNSVTYSVYLKQNGRRYAQCGTVTNQGVFRPVFDLQDGVFVGNVGTNTGATASIESVGNGWFRCIVVHPSNTTDLNQIVIILQDSATYQSYTGDPTKGVFCWGAQLNIGSTAKPYFPTTDRLNVPRLTYQNGGCPSLLLEKQSTNELSYSEQLDNAAWTVKDNLSISANATTSPDGTTNADKLVEDSSNNQHRVYRGIDGTNKSFSFFAKAGERSWLAALSNNGNFTYFDIANGVLGTVAATSSASITAFGNGWFRCVLYNAHGTNGAVIQLALANNGTSYQGDGTSGAFVWGCQMEASSYPTSYIPTTSASATRVEDYPSRSGLALTNFTFAVNFKPLAYIVELFDFEKTGGGRMFYIAVQSNGFLTFNGVSGGTIGAIGPVITINQTCKLAFKLNASTSALTVFINGSNIGTYTTNITTFGAFFGLQSFGYNPGTQIEQIAIFPSVLTDAECITLTTI